MPVPELNQYHRALMTMGLCPFCEAPIRGWDFNQQFAPLWVQWVQAGRRVKAGPGTLGLYGVIEHSLYCPTFACPAKFSAPELRSPDFGFPAPSPKSMQWRESGDHAGDCRWHTTDPLTGHRRDCSMPSVTLR